MATCFGEPALPLSKQYVRSHGTQGRRPWAASIALRWPRENRVEVHRSVSTSRDAVRLSAWLERASPCVALRRRGDCNAGNRSWTLVFMHLSSPLWVKQLSSARFFRLATMQLRVDAKTKRAVFESRASDGTMAALSPERKLGTIAFRASFLESTHPMANGSGPLNSGDIPYSLSPRRGIVRSRLELLLWAFSPSLDDCPDDRCDLAPFRTDTRHTLRAEAILSQPMSGRDHVSN